jgi:Ino eighty subunit 2
MIRWVSSIVGDRVVVRVAAPKGKDEWIGIGSRPTIPDSKTDLKSDVKANGGLAERGRATCAVEGCEERRKYRSVKRFEVGGCSLQHLKQVEAGIQ